MYPLGPAEAAAPQARTGHLDPIVVSRPGRIRPPVPAECDVGAGETGAEVVREARDGLRLTEPAPATRHLAHPKGVAGVSAARLVQEDRRAAARRHETAAELDGRRARGKDVRLQFIHRPAGASE